MKKNLTSVFLVIIFLFSITASANPLPIPKTVSFKNASSTYISGTSQKISIETDIKNIGVSSLIYDVGISKEVKQGEFVFYDQITKHVITPESKNTIEFDLPIPEVVGTTTKDTYVVYVRSYSFENSNVERMIVIGTPFHIKNDLSKKHIEIKNVDVVYGKKKISLLADQPTIRLATTSGEEIPAHFNINIDASSDEVLIPEISYKNIFSGGEESIKLDFVSIKKGQGVYTVKTNSFKDPGSYVGRLKLVDSSGKEYATFGFSYTLHLEQKKVGTVSVETSENKKEYKLRLEVFPYLIDVSEKQQIRKVSLDFLNDAQEVLFSTSTSIDLLRQLHLIEKIPKDIYGAKTITIKVFDKNGSFISEQRSVDIPYIFNSLIYLYIILSIALVVILVLYRKHRLKKSLMLLICAICTSLFFFGFSTVKSDYELPIVNITETVRTDRSEKTTYLFLPILNKDFAAETANCQAGPQDQALFKNDVVLPSTPGTFENNLETIDNMGWSNNGNYPMGQLWLGVSSVDIATAKANKVIFNPHIPNTCGGNSNCHSSARVVCLDCYTGLLTWDYPAVGSRFTYGWFKIADLPRPVPENINRYVYAAYYNNAYYSGRDVFLPINWTKELGRVYSASGSAGDKVRFPIARMTIPLSPVCVEEPPVDRCTNISGNQGLAPLFQAHGRDYFQSLDDGKLYFATSSSPVAAACQVDMCADTEALESDRGGMIWNPSGTTPYEQYSCVQDTPEVCSCSGRTYNCSDNGVQTSSTPNAPQCALTASCSYAQPTGNQVTFNYTATNVLGTILNADSETHTIPGTGSGTITSNGGSRMIGNTGDGQTSEASCSYEYTNNTCTDINNPACNCQPGDTDCDGDIDINDDPDLINPQILSFKTTPYVVQGNPCVFTWQTVDMASCNLGTPSGSASFNTDAGKNITQTLTCLSNEETPRPFKATKTCSVEPAVKQR